MLINSLGKFAGPFHFFGTGISIPPATSARAWCAVRSISKVISVSVNVSHLLHPLFVVEHFQFVSSRLVHEIIFCFRCPYRTGIFWFVGVTTGIEPCPPGSQPGALPISYSHSFASWIRTTISAFKAPRPAVRRRQRKSGRLDSNHGLRASKAREDDRNFAGASFLAPPRS